MTRSTSPFVLFSVAALLATVGSASAQTPEPAPRNVTVSPATIYAPPGFDSNDNTQVVLAGMLPNTCYRAGPDAKVRVDKRAQKIFIANEAYLYPADMCLMMEVPFSKVVNIGMLPPGEYTVYIEDARGGAREMTTLPVALAHTRDADDQVYAVAESATVIRGGRTRSLILSGYLTGGCMHLKEVQVLYRRAGIVEVLPIATVDHVNQCTYQLTRFERKIELNTSWTGEALLHVRSLNGNALNVITRL